MPTSYVSPSRFLSVRPSSKRFCSLQLIAVRPNGSPIRVNTVAIMSRPLAGLSFRDSNRRNACLHHTLRAYICLFFSLLFCAILSYIFFSFSFIFVLRLPLVFELIRRYPVSSYVLILIHRAVVARRLFSLYYCNV